MIRCVYYSGKCVFCNKIVLIKVRNITPAEKRFAGPPLLGTLCCITEHVPVSENDNGGQKNADIANGIHVTVFQVMFNIQIIYHILQFQLYICIKFNLFCWLATNELSCVVKNKKIN